MPQAIPAIFTTLIQAGQIALSTAGLSVGAATAISTAVVYGGTAYAAYSTAAALRGTTKASTYSSINQKARGRLVQGRSASVPREVGYGRVRISGPLIYIGSEGSTNQDLYFIFPIFDHSIRVIKEVEFDGEKLSIVPNGIDGNGLTKWAISGGRYSGTALIKFHNGEEDQLADADFVSELTDWESTDRGRGLAYVAMKLTWDETVYDHRPTVTLIAHTKDEIRDPRTKQTFTSADIDSAGTTITINGHGLEDDQKVKLSTTDSGDLGSTVNDYTTYHIVNKTTNTLQLSDVGDGSPLDLSGIGTGTHGVHEVNFTENNALILSDFIETRRHGHGIGASYSKRIDEDDLVASANTSEDPIDVQQSSGDFTATVSPTSAIIFSSGSLPDRLVVGNRVVLSTTGTLPSGLSPATPYYWIERSPFQDPEYGALATSYVNAVKNVRIPIADTGSGTHTLTRTGEIRYAAAGTYKMSESKASVLKQILSGMAGVAPRYGGKFHIFAGEYTSPTIELDDDDLVKMGRFSTKPPADTRFNATKGIFINPDADWQSDDLPPQTNATYLAQDKDRQVFKDMEFLFTTSVSRGQRLLKIALERHRQGIRGSGTWRYSAYRLTPFANFGLTNARAGFNNKAFEVQRLTRQNLQVGGGPYRAIAMTIQETASTVYDWNSGEETVVDPAPNSNLPSAFEVAPLENLTISSGEPALFFKIDGTAVTRLKIVWDAVTDSFVINGGKIELQYRETSSGAVWLDVTPASGDAVLQFEWKVEEGVEYEVRGRTVNQSGTPSIYAMSNQHTVVGDTTAPAQPSSISAVTADDSSVQFNWTNPTDIDFKEVVIFISYDDSYVDPDGGEIYRGNATSFLFKTFPEATLFFRFTTIDLSGNISSATASTETKSGVQKDFLQDPNFNGLNGWLLNRSGTLSAPPISSGVLTLAPIATDTDSDVNALPVRIKAGQIFKVTMRIKSVTHPGGGGTTTARFLLSGFVDSDYQTNIENGNKGIQASGFTANLGSMSIAFNSSSSTPQDLKGSFIMPNVLTAGQEKQYWMSLVCGMFNTGTGDDTAGEVEVDYILFELEEMQANFYKDGTPGATESEKNDEGAYLREGKMVNNKTGVEYQTDGAGAYSPFSQKSRGFFITLDTSGKVQTHSFPASVTVEPIAMRFHTVISLDAAPLSITLRATNFGSGGNTFTTITNYTPTDNNNFKVFCEPIYVEILT